MAADIQQYSNLCTYTPHKINKMNPHSSLQLHTTDGIAQIPQNYLHVAQNILTSRVAKLRKYAQNSCYKTEPKSSHKLSLLEICCILILTGQKNDTKFNMKTSQQSVMAVYLDSINLICSSAAFQDHTSLFTLQEAKSSS